MKTFRRSDAWTFTLACFVMIVPIAMAVAALGWPWYVIVLSSAAAAALMEVGIQTVVAMVWSGMNALQHEAEALTKKDGSR